MFDKVLTILGEKQGRGGVRFEGATDVAKHLFE